MIKKLAGKMSDYIYNSSEMWINEKDSIFEYEDNILRIDFTAYKEGIQTAFLPEEEPSFDINYVFTAHSATLNEKDLTIKELKELENEVNYQLN